MPVIDLRSDTVTRPTADMRAAMMAAPLGDDVLGDEPTVQALESRVAQLLGTEAALFTPSGTMANQLAIRCHCQHGDEIYAHRDSHIVHYETAAPAAISGCAINPLDGPGGLFDGTTLRSAIRHADIHAPAPRLAVMENTHNRGGGTVWPLAQLAEVAEAARERGLSVHIDGARLWNACVAAGYSPHEVAALADTISVCFSKGLGAPVGSALAGPAPLIARARRFRKMLGGGMRQSGFLAAAAIHALDHHIGRLADDHANAHLLADLLQGAEGIDVDPRPQPMATNMVFFTLRAGMPEARPFCEALARHGVLLIAMGTRRVRAVTHLDAPRRDIERAAAIIRDALALMRRELAEASR
jgi:threonine aldolase